jgi:hypothetical protein
MFRATQNPLNGEITVVRVPALDGQENTFTFHDSAEMRTILVSRHVDADVDRIVKDLNGFWIGRFFCRIGSLHMTQIVNLMFFMVGRTGPVALGDSF